MANYFGLRGKLETVWKLKLVQILIWRDFLLCDSDNIRFFMLIREGWMNPFHLLHFSIFLYLLQLALQHLAVVALSMLQTK